MPELQRLNPRHQKMIELTLQGFKPGEIAEQLGVSREGVTWVLGSAPAQDELARRRASQERIHDDTVASTVVKAAARIEAASLDAANGLVDLMGSQDERVRLLSIKEILDRAGASTSAKSSGATVQILSAERVQLLVQSIRESKGEAA